VTNIFIRNSKIGILLSLISIWGNRFIIAAIIQGAIITGLTLLIVAIQLSFYSTINIIQYLSLSFEGPAKWFFLGYIFYMILVVAIAVTAVFLQPSGDQYGKENQKIEGHSSLYWRSIVSYSKLIESGMARIIIVSPYIGIR
jgi:hypothetical protein